MPNWKKVLTSGSAGELLSLNAPSITGSLLGTASFALTASYVTTLNQNVIITGSLSVGTGSIGPSENTLTLGARDNVQEGGQIGFNAPGGTYTSASFIDNWQNKARILKGNNTTSTGLIAQWDIHTTQMQLAGYTAASSFPGTATANLAVDSGGNVITVSTAGGTVFPYVGNATITGSLTVTQPIYVPINGGMYLQGGDDAALYDINVSNHMGIYGVQDSTIATIKLGSGGGTISGKSGNIGIGTINPTSASLTVNGNVWATSFTGSLLGTASYATQALSSSYSVTASYALRSLTSSHTQYVEYANVGNKPTLISSSAQIATDISGAFTSTSASLSATINNVIATTVTTSSFNSFTSSYTTGSFTGSFFGDGSGLVGVISASYAESASYSLTSSYSISSSQAISASYAISSSHAETASIALSSLNASDILIYVKNTTGDSIAKGKVVRIFGATGDNALISTASYDADSVSANTLGILNETIADQAFGYVMTEGKLLGINTDAFTSGQLLYLGPTGSIIGYEPVPPLHAVRLGQALRVQQINGSMYVRIDNGYELDELHNVLIVSGSDGDLLVASGSNGNGKKLYINSRQLTGSYGLTGSLTITGSTSTDLFRITQTGTGNAFVVEDSTNPDATPFVINSTGSIGIGTTLPSHKLHVSTADPTLALIERTGGANSHIQYKNTNGSMWAGLSPVGNFAIGNGIDLSTNHQLTVISSSGNVGIGTTTPTQKLTVSGGSILLDNSTALKHKNTSGTELDMLTLNAGNSLFLGSGQRDIYFRAGNNNIVYVTSSAVGIGTSTPNATLDVNGNAIITGSLTVTNNLTILGSASIQYITSSQLNIFDNIISVNTNTPAIRFGGLAVNDSGSTPIRSGSLLFDSQNNQWIFVHQNTAGGDITSSALLMGPQTFNNVGGETSLTANQIPKASGADLGEHLTDSNITDTGTIVSINSNTQITGSVLISDSLTVGGIILGNGGMSMSGSNNITGSLIISGSPTALRVIGDNIITGSLRVTSNITGSGLRIVGNSVITGNSTIGNSLTVNQYIPSPIGITVWGDSKAIYAINTNDGGGIGIDSTATGNGGETQAGDFIGGRFEGVAGNGGVGYSVQLVDGTQGIGKVLVSQTSDGKANWSTKLSGSYEVTGSLTVSGSYNSPGGNTIDSNALIQASLLYLSNNF